MELLSEIWDKTTDTLTAFSEGVSEGLVRLFGSSNEQIRQMRSMVAHVNELEPGMTVLSEDELRARTPELRHRARKGNRSIPCCRKHSPRSASRAAAI